MRASAHPQRDLWCFVRRPRGRSPRAGAWLRRHGCTRNTRIYQAAAALPHANREWATYELANQLRIMTAVADATPDWSTFVATGPIEVAGVEERARFEWTGRVAARGVSLVDEQPDPDTFPPASSVETPTLSFGLDSPLS